MTEKSLQKKAEEAHNRQKQFLMVTAVSSELQLKLLWQMYYHKDYIPMGFDNFKDYLSAPTNSSGLGVSYSWALQQIKVYEKYVRELNWNVKEVAQLGTRKLYELIPETKKKKKNEIVSLCSANTLKDIQKEKRGQNELTCKHERVKQMWHCLGCDSWFPYDPQKNEK